MVDRGDHVLFGGFRYHILITTIYDDGEQVGPENMIAVAPTIARAHAYIAERFNNDAMRTEAIDDDPLRSYYLLYGDETKNDCRMTIWPRLIPIA